MRLERWLNSTVIVAEGLDSVPAAHMVVSNHLQHQFQESHCPFLTSTGTRYAHGTHTGIHCTFCFVIFSTLFRGGGRTGQKYAGIKDAPQHLQILKRKEGGAQDTPHLV